MDKLTITIKKYECDTTVVNGRILETNQQPKGDYKETESLMNVSDVAKKRQEFIEKTANNVMKANKAEEYRILEHRGSQRMKKLVITNIN